VVKVTPAHDVNDYAVGQRHELAIIGVLTLEATLNDAAPEAYRGLDRFVARKKIVADLDALGVMVEIRKHRLMVPRCARTGQVIEPMLTDQWFVAMSKVSAQDPTGKSIAQKAIDAVDSGAVLELARTRCPELRLRGGRRGGIPGARLGGGEDRVVSSRVGAGHDVAQGRLGADLSGSRGLRHTRHRQRLARPA
jgi:hypothetical protein